MGQIILSILIDGLMAMLLIVTIIYCGRLNRRIRILQDSESELAQIIREFDESTQRATQSLGQIHEVSLRMSENIQHKIDKGNYLADDLQFMIEKGSKVADRMEGKISSSRGAAPEPVKQARYAPDLEETTPDVAAPQEVPAVRRGAREARAPREAAPVGGAATSRSSLNQVLQKMSGRKSESAPEADGAKRPVARLRSKAEQELFDALKTGGGKV